MVATSDFNRSLSRIFTNPEFKRIAFYGRNEYFLSQLKKYDKLLSIDTGMLVKDVIENAYGYLSKNYRNEYVYKNTILNNILLGRHNLRTATMLNEFKVGSSIADTFIINGTSTIYEIKTELDTPDKLKKQISDYQKVCAKIYIVTHHTLVKKYASLLENTSVGLLSLSGRFNLSMEKEAVMDHTNFCNTTMMKTLKKEEYSNLIITYTGSIPNVSNIHFFSKCLSIVNDIENNVLHDMVIAQLRKRKPIEIDLLQTNQIPKEIKHICHCINPNKLEYTNLLNFLSINV